MQECARINALDTELANSTTIADATLVLMGNLSGPDLTALFALALRILPGLVTSSMLIISILGLNAPTKVFATDPPVNVNAFLDMKE